MSGEVHSSHGYLRNIYFHPSFLQEAFEKADKIKKARSRGKDWYVQKHNKLAL